MGPEFEIYEGRRAPYIPNGDFRFVDRIMRLDGTRGELKAGAHMETEYDAPPEAWYFHDNSFAGMPNCVYMESSLQAAILLGYYLGGTLQSPDEELAIRNLDGHAEIVADVDLRGKTIRHSSTMLSSQAVPGVVLQKFRYELSADGEVFYVGESLFGYFSAQALSNQVGLDNGKLVAPWVDSADGPDPAKVLALPVAADDEWFVDRPGRLRLADKHLRLVDSVDLVADGGAHDLGYVRGRRRIDPNDWYFSCHFHRDPVMPGSLGVEAVLQALQLFAIRTGIADDFTDPVFAMPRGVSMAWSYRGQILRTDEEMTFDLHVKEIRREAGRILVIADASVWKHVSAQREREPGLRIYELTDVAVQINERSASDTDDNQE
jgi:3-hydroxymyristoyl/3-hydroxydecanoyl-(acyl carrier protein) dehydratase